MALFKVYAQEITNPALTNLYPSAASGGSGFALLIANLWRTIILVGGLALLLYLVWGGAQYLMAGEDKAKVEGAQNRIRNAILGMAILAASVAIVFVLELALGLNILDPVFTSPGGS